MSLRLYPQGKPVGAPVLHQSSHIPAMHYRVRLVRFLRLDCRIAETIERNNAFTVFDDLKMAAMSGSSTTAIASSDILEANRFGFDLR